MEYSNRTFSSIGQMLYLCDQTADVNFIFQPDSTQIEVVPAHKVHLATASSEFRMLFNQYDEEHGKTDGKCYITMVNVTAGAFKEFLKFFYFSEVEISMENAAEVMELGLKFGIDTYSNFKNKQTAYNDDKKRFY